MSRAKTFTVYYQVSSAWIYGSTHATLSGAESSAAHYAAQGYETSVSDDTYATSDEES